jgi:diguanylate cyclase (GGDEF)-like protein
MVPMRPLARLGLLVSVVITATAVLGTLETVHDRRSAQDHALQTALAGTTARVAGNERQIATAVSQMLANPAIRGLLTGAGGAQAQADDLLYARGSLGSFEREAMVAVSAVCVDDPQGRQLACGPGARSVTYPLALGRRFARIAAASAFGGATTRFVSPVDGLPTIAFVAPMRIGARLVGFAHIDVGEATAQAMGTNLQAVQQVTVRLAGYEAIPRPRAAGRSQLLLGAGAAIPLPDQHDLGRQPWSLLLNNHRAMIAAWPLTIGGTGRRLAVLATETEPNPAFMNSWTAAELILLALGGFTLLGSIAAMLLANRRMRLELCIDPLTRLHNRRALMEELPRVCERASEEQPAYVWFFDLNGFKNYNDSFGHLAGDALLTRLGARLQAAVRPRGKAFRLGGDEFCVLVSAPVADPHGFFHDAREALSERGGAFTVTASAGAVEIPREASDPTHALRLADHHMYRDKAASKGGAAELVTAVLHAALAQRHPELDEHSSDVANDVELLARTIGLDEDAIDMVIRAGDLHDVGKLGIPDEIITKPGPLTDGEWEFMRQHTVMGERIIAAAGPSLQPIAPLVRASHERWDGQGYPDGLAGQEIPLGARIITICDSFRAMLSERPYKKSMSLGDALAELRRCAGTQFDPELVDVFCRLVEQSAFDRPRSTAG